MIRPEPLKPAYNFISASEPVILSQGTVGVSLDGAAYLGTADLLLQFVPSPRLIFHACVQGGKASPLVFAFNEPTESSFSFSGLDIEGICGARKVGENFENWELDWHPLEPLALCDMQPKDSVSAIFHLFNFPDFHGGQHQDAAPAGCPLLILTSEEWKFSVQALPEGATREAWKRIKGEDICCLTHMVKLLLSLCGVPCEIISAVPDISKKNDTFNKGSRWRDGPHGITDIRNSLMHPVSKKDVSGCHFDAWKLSLWYLELSVLALCGYDGTYTNRLTATYTSDSESVPWGESA